MSCVAPVGPHTEPESDIKSMLPFDHPSQPRRSHAILLRAWGIGESWAAPAMSRLFAMLQPALIPMPSASPPPRPPTARRKMLAIHRTGFSLRRSSTSVRERRHSKPVAKEAETFVCTDLGIIPDGEAVTEKALDEFALQFKDQSNEVILPLRVLFKLDSGRAVDDAMINLAGAASLDQILIYGATTANDD